MANIQFHTLDPLGQSAIELGLDSINALSPIEELTLELDELTKQKLKRLSSSMSLSIRTLIESAINYTYAYAVETHKTSAEFQTLMPMPGTFSSTDQPFTRSHQQARTAKHEPIRQWLRHHGH